jgi:hypothetical protein
LAEISAIVSKTQNNFINFQEFERILIELAEISFKNANPAERFSLLLQKLTQKTRTLSGSDFDVKTAFGLAKKLEMTTRVVNNSVSQRNIVKKQMIKSKISESLLKQGDKKRLNGGSAENILRTLKSDDKNLNLSSALNGKNTRTSSVEAKVEVLEKPQNKIQGKLVKVKNLILKLKNKKCKSHKSLKSAYKSVDFLQKQRKNSFSSDFFLKIILRSWHFYTKSKKHAKP